jgi:hypothetical protein
VMTFTPEDLGTPEKVEAACQELAKV